MTSRGVSMRDKNGDPTVKLYLPYGCDYSEFWIMDCYGNLHQKDNGDTWVRYGEYEDGVIYVPEADIDESEKSPRTFS